MQICDMKSIKACEGILGCFYPRMDGENNGSNPIKMDDLGGKPPIFGNTHFRTSNSDILHRVPSPIFLQVSETGLPARMIVVMAPWPGSPNGCCHGDDQSNLTQPQELTNRLVSFGVVNSYKK